MWVNMPLHVLGSPLAPPMWGMPALLGHRDIFPNAALWFAVAPPPPKFLKLFPWTSTRLSAVETLEMVVWSVRGGKAGHPHAEHRLHGDLELLSGEAR